MDGQMDEASYHMKESKKKEMINNGQRFLQLIKIEESSPKRNRPLSQKAPKKSIFLLSVSKRQTEDIQDYREALLKFVLKIIQYNKKI